MYMYRNTYAEINVDNLQHNVKEIIQKYPDYQYYFGIVKGNAYGHSDKIAKYLLESGINSLAVASLEEAIAHINHYNTGHSEAIITENYQNALKFQDYVDAAAVYVNASTRFTDGFEFGFGAEIGISTQKLHARGPMGLAALTTTKYIIFGNGQIRK